MLLLVSSYRGRGGADDLIQLPLQADAPVSNLHQTTYLRMERLSTSVEELFLNGKSDSCVLVSGRLKLVEPLLPACSRSPCCPNGVENVLDLTPVLHWSSLCAPEDWTSASPAVQEDGQIDPLIKNCFLDAFCLLSDPGVNRNVTFVLGLTI